jgi:plasmid maintenance system antidote protein VapI
VALASGISRSHIKSLCIGQRFLTTESVERLRAVLDVPARQWALALKERPFRRRRAHAATVGHDAAHMEGAKVAPSSVNDAEAA